MLRLIALLIALAFALTSAGPAFAGGKAPITKSDKPAATKKEPLDINTVSEDELKTLPGIDDAYAKKIIDGRPYKRKDELVQKKIVPLRQDSEADRRETVGPRPGGGADATET